MSVLSPSQQSTSTFCSEAEETGFTKQKWSDVTRIQQENPVSKAEISQNIRSSRYNVSPSILSQDYTQRPSLFPLSQKSQRTKTTCTAPTTQPPNGSRSKDVYKIYDRVRNKVKNVTNITFANNILSKYPRNRMFDTQNKYGEASAKVTSNAEFNTDNSDTISITSEAVSKIVDKEIELYRVRKQKRILSRSQRPYFSTAFPSQESSTYCPCLNRCQDYFRRDKYKPIHVAYDRQQTNEYVASRSKIIPTSSSKKESVNETKQYNLTKDHINKLAAFFAIDVSDLTSAIENVIIGKSLEPTLSDDDSLISCSQSPIRRRYTSSQSTSFSNASR